jgi:uncharacterized Zn-binding protein involved in type VI secretion
MSAFGAARTGDEIGHGIGMLGMLAGAVGGALVGMAIVAGTVATGGVLAGVITATIIAGSVAGGATATHQIIKGVAGVSRLPDPPTGFLAHGSHSVMINSLPAARATGDGSYACTGGVGMYWNHPVLPIMGILPSGILVAEGSKTVLFNNLPAARVGSVLTCGAKIVSGSSKVFIGGATVRTEFVWDGVGWLETGFLGLGMVALGGGAVLAVVASVVTVSLLPVAVFGAATWGSYKALEGLGQVGDMIGPGCKDLFQGVAGMGLLLAGPAMAKRKTGDVETIAIESKKVPSGVAREVSDEAPTLPFNKRPSEEPITLPFNKRPSEERITRPFGRYPEEETTIPLLARIETILFGHGGWKRSFGTFIVPEGTEITVYSKHGAKLSLGLAENIAKGQFPEGLYKRTYKAGERMPDYELSPARKFRIVGSPLRVTENTRLSAILKPGMGKCHWCACTHVKGTKMAGFAFTSHGVVKLSN